MGVKAYSVVKYIFFAFNVLFWLLGCGVLGTGIWLHMAKGTYASIAPNFSFLSATALCIAAGVIVLVIGFFGCCGAIMENQCMLLTYFLFVVVIFALEIVAGILAFIYRTEVERLIKDELREGIKQKYPPPSSRDEEGLSAAWETMQQDFKCCGVTNHTDWYNSNGWPEKKWVPDSCCIIRSTNCGHSGKPHLWYRIGCLGEMKYWLKSNLYILGVVGITIGVIQILGMVAAMVLFCCLRNDKYYE
ncbi:unnamed protein product [Owenia fusiformis]|uniref:Tetraspanin n=1 Tax=Owenia fusiformis TaxID=6347 RepID=A0A8J1U152_OWEFU|nr:unnamed protein product [Owenia fusiformis]